MRVQLASEYVEPSGDRLGGPDEVVELPDARAELLIREGHARLPDDETGLVGLSGPKPSDQVTEAVPVGREVSFHGRSHLDELSQAQAKQASTEPQPTPTVAGSDASVVAPGPEGGQGTQGAAGGGSGGSGGTGSGTATSAGTASGTGA